MQLKEINRNETIEHKKKLEKYRKAIEGDISNSNMLSKEVATQEKTIKENLVVKKKVTKKKVIDKKALKEKRKAVTEKVVDGKGKINIKKDYPEEDEESKVVISKEERAERFKKLHAIAQDTMKKWDE